MSLRITIKDLGCLEAAGIGHNLELTGQWREYKISFWAKRLNGKAYIASYSLTTDGMIAVKERWYHRLVSVWRDYCSFEARSDKEKILEEIVTFRKSSQKNEYIE